MIDFDNTEIAFRDKTNYELKKARWLFSLVGSDPLVKTGSVLLQGALRVKLPVSWALKPTVFNHFCGGETINECDPTIQKLGESNVLTILDYSAEGKDNEEDFEYTRQQIQATIDKAVEHRHIPYAVFKPSGLAREALLEKVQAGHQLTDSEQQEMDRVKTRFDDIIAYGAKRGIPVMVDSEETWIQEVVDGMVDDLMLRYNKEKPIVFNTLQMYRHDRLDYLKKTIVRCREKGVYPAFKLVRGAYMEKEREHARKAGNSSPIYPDKASTDKAFDEATAICLANADEVAVCIATHNEISCLKAADVITTNSLPLDHPHISFAQLLGMSDHISYNLAAAGYNVCKYVPYGPVETVVPYLIRRAEENTSVAGQTSRELFLIKKELRRRKGA